MSVQDDHEGDFWFSRSAYWGDGVWFAHESGRDLGRVARCRNDESCCYGWHAWKDKYPASGTDPERNRPDVTAAGSRLEAAERLSALWKESHGSVRA